MSSYSFVDYNKTKKPFAIPPGSRHDFAYKVWCYKSQTKDDNAFQYSKPTSLSIYFAIHSNMCCCDTPHTHDGLTLDFLSWRKENTSDSRENEEVANNAFDTQACQHLFLKYFTLSTLFIQFLLIFVTIKNTHCTNIL